MRYNLIYNDKNHVFKSENNLIARLKEITEWDNDWIEIVMLSAKQSGLVSTSTNKLPKIDIVRL